MTLPNVHASFSAHRSGNLRAPFAIPANDEDEMDGTQENPVKEPRTRRAF